MFSCTGSVKILTYIHFWTCVIILMSQVQLDTRPKPSPYKWVRLGFSIQLYWISQVNDTLFNFYILQTLDPSQVLTNGWGLGSVFSYIELVRLMTPYLTFTFHIHLVIVYHTIARVISHSIGIWVSQVYGPYQLEALHACTNCRRCVYLYSFALLLSL